MRRSLAVAGVVAAILGTFSIAGSQALAATPTCNGVGDAWTGAVGPIKIPSYNSGGTQNLSCNMVKGNVSSAVRNLQTELNKCFGAQLAVDGNFGTNTYNALKRAQSAAGTTADGVYGPNTRHAFAITRGWWSGSSCLWVDA
ncbi:peptidoglycan-binding domain-containing protein [Streptomyces smaragdinus]|uniref:peptidoglycan-binding domain-containing protein n=1 Tax=Streptomyces smaragdinus TaxID=2585196 RepID=UPI002B21106B|nr:peptidoglycan-binding domain-containing protein [Streptomyces smaragdinus]